MITITKKYLLLAATMLISLSSPALSPGKENSDIWVPLIDSPAGELVYFKPGGTRQLEPDSSWSIRTGIKKGMIDRTFEQERFAGPDAAVLNNGFFEPWTDLLSEFKEPSVVIDPNRLAGLQKTKPYLIIPSGALRGFSSSSFFKAGLAEYARSGGVIICFAQQNSVDFTALPVPAGARIEARGWQQDDGPLFRASSVQNRHPMLASMRKTIPDIETSGYLTAYPDQTNVVLSRSDGFPTLIVYPYGYGWVVVTTLFSDYAFAQGQLNQEEKDLVRDLLFWAKAPGLISEASPGERLRFPLFLQGSELGEASWVRLRIMGSDSKPLSEETVTVSVRPNQVTEANFAYTVPAGTQPGMYRIEYVLYSAAGQALSVSAETRTGRFSVGQPAKAAPTLRQQPLRGVTAPFSVQPSLERIGSNLRMNLEIDRDRKTPAGADQSYLIRAAGQEKTFTLGNDRQILSFDVAEQTSGRALSFIVSHKTGRSLFRGAIPVSSAPGTQVALDKPFYVPGQKAALTMTSLGSGEFFLMAPGLFNKKMMTGDGGSSYPVPALLPAGTYRILWKMTSLEGGITNGELPINIDGYRVRILDEALEHSVNRGATTTRARFRIHSTRKIEARMKLELHGPDGSIMPAAEGPITLSDGEQEIPFTFSFKPEAAGIWALHYSVEARLPEGPGFTRAPVILAAGSTLFDAGAAAVLGVAADRPVYYEASGPVGLSAYLMGNGNVKLELFLDSESVKKERIDLAGPHTYTASLPGMKPGLHVLKAVVMNDEFTSTGAQSFIYGARSPDLVAELKLPEPTGLVLPIHITIQNQGKRASGRNSVALYEGDPAAGGSLISRADVPALEPGAIHQGVVNWPLAAKAGKRKLIAVVDPDNTIGESNENNNQASVETTIPKLLLALTPGKNSFSADENITFSLYTANLSTAAYLSPGLKVELANPAGKSVSAEVIPLAELAPGAEKTFSRMFTLASPPRGTYRINARLDTHTNAVSADITILPTLMLQGSLESTPAAAALCMPFTLRYTIKNTGNLSADTGSLILEIQSAASGTVVYARQLPLVLGPATLLMDKLDFPAGKYLLKLRASAIHANPRIARDFALAEQGLAVTAPVVVTRAISAIPRVLMRIGESGSPVRQAVAVKIAQQAFDDTGAFLTIADNEDSFKSQALSGLFNTYVLFENDELSGQTGWLRDLVSRGQGLVIIGSGEGSRAFAEVFGFGFSETTESSGSLLLFTENTGMAISGTIPISGRMLVPRKNNAKPAALFAGDGKPAALIDGTESGGRVLVMPFSLSRSAVDTGSASLYSLLFRAAVERVAPKNDEPSGVFQQELTVSAHHGPVKARIIVTVPAGSVNIWTNAAGAVKNNVLTYELTADQEPQKILFLYQAPAEGVKQPVIEVFYECGGYYLAQGKVE